MSKQLERVVSGFFMKISKSQKTSMWMMSLLYWPGVLIHELSHLLMGRLLLVKTGGLTIIPKMERGGQITMGSVQVPRTDRFRFFLIGVAPVYIGIGIILLSLWLAERYQLMGEWIWMVIIGYIVFQVANNMFLSSSDLKGATWLLLLLVLLGGIFYWLGWRPSFDWVIPWLDSHSHLFNQVVNWLWVPVIIDAVVLLVIWIFPALLRR